MRELLEQFVPPVYRFALRLTGDAHSAEDLTQEAMLRAWRHRKTLRDPARARVWLFRIVHNLHRDSMRRRVVRDREQAAPGRPAEHAPAPDRAAEAVEQASSALAALDALPPRQREVLYLSVCEGLSIPHIAEVLGVNDGAVKASLSFARKQVRARLESAADITSCRSAP